MKVSSKSAIKHKKNNKKRTKPTVTLPQALCSVQKRNKELVSQMILVVFGTSFQQRVTTISLYLLLEKSDSARACVFE